MKLKDFYVSVFFSLHGDEKIFGERAKAAYSTKMLILQKNSIEERL